MEYTLIPSTFFLEQLTDLSVSCKKQIDNKLELLKKNPYRNKKITGYPLFLFRIRFKDEQKEKRIVYLVDKPYVKILCIQIEKITIRTLEHFLKHGYL